MTRFKDAIDFTFALLKGKPTTLAGFGITDAASDAELAAHAAVVASDTVSGHVQVDGTTIMIAAGVISSVGGGGGAPSGPAGGVLGGTYPNPSFAADMATQAELDTHTGNTSNPHSVTAAQVGAQPLDSDLTAIAALTTTAYGRALLALADAAALRTAGGLVIGTNVQAPATTLAGYGITDAQPLDSDLTAIAALTTTSYGRSLLEAANAAALRTLAGLGTLATANDITASLISDASANGRSLITAADYTAMKTLLGLVIGTNVQAWDADLDAIAALTTTAFGRSYLALADAAAARNLAASAPRAATYITQTADSELSAEQALSALATGYVKNTTGTGVLSVQATPIPAADMGSGAVGAGAKVLADNQTWITPAAGSGNSGASGSLFTHFFSTPSGIFSALEFSGSGSGTGVAITGLTAPDAASLGVLNLNCGTATNSRQGILTLSSSILFGGGTLELMWRFQVLTLPDGTDSFGIWLGFGDNANTQPIDGAYIYLDNTNGNFRYKTRSNSTETNTDSGVTAAAATWYVAKITVNAAATSVNFQIGTPAAANLGNSQNNTTNVPTAAGRETGIGANIFKTAGTTARNLYVDYCSFAWSGVSA